MIFCSKGKGVAVMRPPFSLPLGIIGGNTYICVGFFLPFQRTNTRSKGRSDAPLVCLIVKKSKKIWKCRKLYLYLQ